MTNNLLNLKKDLKSFAKKCKDFKYTDSALLTFLLNGMLISTGEMFAETVTKSQINNQVSQINTSINQMRTDFKRARAENNKLIKDTNLELTQLMEQGDHVTKSPWSSWQFGANGFYSDWHGTYKGKGNKISNIIYKRDQTLNKYIAKPVSEKNANNTTLLGFAYEPNAEIPISASITPKSISKVNPNIKKNVTIAGLPSFEPRVVNDPLAPKISTPNIEEPTPITLESTSLGNSSTAAILGDNANGVIQGVIVTKGNIKAKRSPYTDGEHGNWNYTLDANTNFSGVNSYSSSVTSGVTGIGAVASNAGWNYTFTTPYNHTSTGKTGFFQISANNTGTSNITVNNSNVLYTNEVIPDEFVAELVHQDIHRGTSAEDLRGKLETAISEGTGGFTAVGEGAKGTEILKAYKNAVAYTNNSNLYAGAYYANGGAITSNGNSLVLPFINSGNVTMEGKVLAFSNSYDHDNTNNVAGLIINTGDINVNPYQRALNNYDSEKNAVFVLSNDIYGRGNQQTYYNSGNVNTWTKETAIFLLDARLKRPVNIANTDNGQMNMYAEKSSGIYIKTPTNLNLNFTNGIADGTTTTTNGVTHTNITGDTNTYHSMKIYGDKSTGLYIPNTAATSTVTGYFGVDIGDTLGTSNKNFSNTTATTQGTVITNYNVNPTIGTDSLNVYHDEVTTKHAANEYITKTTKNTNIQGSAGIYSFGGLDLQGHQIRIYDNTDGNVGVYSADNVVYNLGDGTMLLEKGKNNTAIAVGQNKGKVISASEITLTDGVGNVGIYAATAGSKRTSTTPTETVTAKSITSTNTVNSIGIFADKGAYVELSNGMTMTGAKVSDNPIIKVKDSNNEEFGGENAGAVYAKGSGSTVVINQTALPTSANIDITGKEIVEISATDGSKKGTGNYAGFGLYADGGAKIEAKNNVIKVTNGGTAIASTGSSTSKVDLTGSTVEYDGKGYALHSADDGQIDLTSGTLILRGSSTGYSRNVTGSSPITLSGTTLNVFSNDVIVMNLNGVTSFNTNGSKINGVNAISTYLPTTINNVESGTTYDGYKYTVLDNVTVNVDSNIDKADTTGAGGTTPSDSYIFTRRLQLQNSIINVLSGNTVKAHLNTTELNSINPDLSVPVGLDISASGKSTSRATTGVNVANGATISVDRTDSGNGGVGAYVNYGKVHNEGKIEVEKTTPNDHAVGIYATNGTEVNNDTTGTVEVGGKDSIGILGLSYRIDSKNNVVYEKFSTGGVIVPNGIGHVDITNKGKITLDGDNALGIYAKNNSLDATGVNAGYLRSSTSNTSATNDGEITLAGKNAIGMITEGGKITNDSNGKITINGQEGVAMYGTVAKDSATPTVNKVHSQLINKGTITLADTTATTPIIGMFTNDPDTSITTSGTINVGKKSYGVYGASNNVSMTGGAINVGDDGVGIFATGSSDTTTPTSTVTLSGGTITVGTNKAVGVFIADDANYPLKTTVTNTGTNVNVGNDSFGYVVDSTTGTDLILGSATNKLTSSLDTDSVYVYSNDKNGFVYSNTDITTNGGRIYGLYTAGRAENYGNMDLRGGTGNVGIYSTGTSPTGVGATNYGTITVGGTNLTAKEYGIGMATGYYNETTGAISNEGLIENRGTLNVVGDNSIGMYAVGSGSKAINAAGATIDISGKNATGMYIDQGAEGINYGTIKSTGSAKGIKGVATVNGGYIKNYGTISITSPDGIGIYQDAASALSQKNVPGNVSGTKANVYSATSTDQKYIVTPKGTLLIQNPPKTPRLTVNGREVELTGLDTNTASPTPSYVTAGATTLDLSLPQFADFKNSVSNAQATELGMYVDTSGVNYTHPIEGLSNLVGLDNINLIIGTEASKYTNAKAIEIGSNIIKPYNDAISSLTTTGTTLNINSAGLTWLAQPLQGTSTPIEKLYMIKIPYTFFTSEKDENSYNFLDGLEQRYGVEGLGTRERQIFDKLNGIGKGETELFTQAVDEMKGHQYSNTQQRINATGNALDKEFRYLRHEWRNPSKQNNKIKAFGLRDEYNTDTAGVIDYTSNAYGVAYVHEDEKIRMGNSSGWYAGAVTNRFKFKDIGHSREDQTMVKLGIFKTMSPKKDYNGSLQWTIGGDVFAGVNNMKRKFLVVDDVFEAKSNYNSYGAALKTDLGYDIRMSERTHLRPYGGLKMEYGRFNNIKEDSGQMRLEVKGNDYFSVKPEAGLEFKYVQPLAVRTNLTVGLTAAYENELGKLQNGNQARVRYTTAGWYNLEKEKEDRRGNGKFDLNIGVDNTRFGVTVNAGYDTKGSNIRGGIGFRAIY